MMNNCAFVFMCVIILAKDECVAVRKFYSRPLKFRYVQEDQETSGTIHQDKSRGKHESVEKSEESAYNDKNQEEEKNHKKYKNYHEHNEKELKNLDEGKRKHRYDEGKRDGNKRHNEAKYHNEKSKGHKGNKSMKFKEEAKYQKGYSTKGEHNIIKKDEYEKNYDFYDEFHEDDSRENESGDYFKQANHEKSHHKILHNTGVHHKEEKGKRENYHLSHENDSNNQYSNNNEYAAHLYYKNKHNQNDNRSLGKLWAYRP